MKQAKTTDSFNLVFATVLALTLSSGGAALHLANQPTITEAQTRVLNNALTLCTAGATAIIGLLGVATIKPHD